MGEPLFPAPGTKAEIENGAVLAPKFDDDGLIVCITTDADDGTVLMVGYMNAESLHRTIETGEAWYWSRSRGEFWRKGATSGQTQQVIEIRTDCDQDAILLRVKVGGNGGTCHAGYRSCFYRSVEKGPDGSVRLIHTGGERL
ncbi:phosphoribosyl-AMP cyclohydrolase [Stappia sp. F7233]|uniref:Phosphoribosyl-AMP cyclohydrolase n=1 Tax=Stappia albiluteola TaxID=2758565 RepID=A0A839AFE5_9HYPH|nr:phosphoribosyl-AMP cyclohydrolase [Stappia albiluteola]MBA5777612.1 phosphoribosyl-AMP cyclohydrolase [Stappia albiluteola]